MKISTLIKTLLASMLLWTLPATTQAIMLEFESLEWITQTSQRIVVAKVVGVAAITGSDSERTEYQTVTIAISKTLKGTAHDRDTILVDRAIDKDKAARWLADGVDILLFLNPNDGKKIPIPAAQVGWVLRHDGHCPDAISLGPIPRDDRAYILALTEDFTVLTQRDAILEGVLQAIAAAPTDAAPRSCTFAVHDDTAVFKAVNGGSAVLLTVPVDAKLESEAQAWCKARSPDDRGTGAWILQNFRSDQNIALLKSLLDDPTNDESAQYASTGPNGQLELVYRKKVFTVREAAFNSLQKLGVEVPKPVLEILLDGGGDGKI